MKAKIFSIILYASLAFLNVAFSQSGDGVGIGTNSPDVSAILDVSAANKGVLVSRLSAVQRIDLATTTSGLLVYDSTLKHFFYYDGTTPYSAAHWKMVATTDDFATPTNPAEKGLDIFLVAGQSNTHAGYFIDSINDAPDPEIFQLGRFGSLNYKVIVAKENLQHWTSTDNYMGFALTFAKLYKQELAGTGRKVLIIPCGYGNTKIAQWQHGTVLYNDIIDRVRYALSFPDSRLMAILWHQGENDMSKGNTTYQGELDTLITTIRQDLGNPLLPFIAGGLVPYVVHKPGYEHRMIIQNIIKDTPNRLPKTGYADSESPFVIEKADNTVNETHFDATGMREMGKRYFNVYMGLK